MDDQPVQFTRMSTTSVSIDTRVLQEYQQLMQARPRPSMVWSDFAPSQTRASITRQKKAHEKEQVQSFLDTGMVPRNLFVFATAHGWSVCGEHIQGSQVIFTIVNDTLYANKTRTNHLTAMLTKIAKREGLRVEYVDGEPELHTGIRTAFVPWQKRKEVDDSELMATSTPRLLLEEPEEDCDDPDSCDCGCEDEEVPF